MTPDESRPWRRCVRDWATTERNRPNMSAPDCRTCDRGSVNRCDPWESTSGATVDATVDAITRKEDTE